MPLPLSINPRTFERLRGFSHLPLHYRHGNRLKFLPGHHADPFDRILIAQAMEEGLRIVTHDRRFAA